MTQGKLRLAAVMVAASVLPSLSRADDEVKGGDPSVFGVFAGSSPCGESIRSLFRIPADATSAIQWSVTLHQDPKTRTPAGYQLRCDYARRDTGTSRSDTKSGTVERQGRWTIAKGVKSNPDAVVYELDGAVSLVEIDHNLLHLLNADRSLIIGNGGWSYTLNRTEASEKPAVPSPAFLSRPDQSYQLTPLATGPSVFGVFEGRSPAQGIARELKIAVDADAPKAKWRVTLYQNPETRAPTTYKVEGTLHRQGMREGNWTIARGTESDSNAIVYQLDPTKTEAALLLLRGDDDVLFFLNQKRSPLVGHAEFSYTLNRRSTSPAADKPAD